MGKPASLKHLIRNADGSTPEPFIHPNWHKKPGLLPALLTTVVVGLGGLIGAGHLIEKHEVAKLQKAQQEEAVIKHAMEVKDKITSLHSELRNKPLVEFKSRRYDIRKALVDYNELTSNPEYQRLEKIGTLRIGRSDELVRFLQHNLSRVQSIKTKNPLLLIPSDQFDKAMRGTIGRENLLHLDLPYLITKRKLAARVEKEVPKRDAKGNIVKKKGEIVTSKKTFIAPSQQELEAMYKVLQLYSDPKKYDPVASLQAVQAVKRVLKDGGYSLSRLPDDENAPANVVTYDKFATQLDQTWNAVRENYLRAIQEKGLQSVTPLPDGSLQISLGLPLRTRGYWVSNHPGEEPRLAATAINLHIISGVGTPIRVPAANTRQIIIRPSMLQDPNTGMPATAVFTFTHDLNAGSPEDVHGKFILNKQGKLEPFNKPLQLGQVLPESAIDPAITAFTTPTDVEQEELRLTYYPDIRVASRIPMDTDDEIPDLQPNSLMQQKQVPYGFIEEQPNGKRVWKSIKTPQNSVRAKYTINNWKWSSPERKEEHFEQKRQMIGAAIREIRKNYPVLTVQDGRVVLLGLSRTPEQETVVLEPIEIKAEEEIKEQQEGKPAETDEPVLNEPEEMPQEPSQPPTQPGDEDAPPTYNKQGRLDLQKANEWKIAAEQRKRRIG